MAKKVTIRWSPKQEMYYYELRGKEEYCNRLMVLMRELEGEGFKPTVSALASKAFKSKGF